MNAPPDDDEDTERRRAIKEMPERLARYADTIGAPSEYAGHHTFLLAFKRGVLMGMNARLTKLPSWYIGEETRRAYQRGWHVGRHRLEVESREAS